MAVFEYDAKNINGQAVHGTVDARNKALAITLLKSQNLYVVNIFERKNNIGDFFSDLKGIPSSDVVTFTRQFSTMISAGLPIARGLEVLGAQIENKKFKKVIYDILRSVEGGASLSTALGQYPVIFSTTYQALVRAGESSGKLDEILKRLADTMESSRELNARFKGAMVYPIIVLLTMVGVFVVLMVFVIPKLADMYENMNVELPFVTKMMILVSDFMVNNMLLIIVVVAGIVIGIRSFLHSDKGRILMSELVFRMPVFGKITRQKDVSQFCRTLSLLISSAVPIVDALNIVATVMSSPTFRNTVLDAAKQVEKGNSISSYFRSSPIFPPLLGQMAGVGEETGKMDEVLDRVATYYESEVDHLVKGLSAALEPIILVMLGGMVGFLIISIITPIYKITSAF